MFETPVSFLIFNREDTTKYYIYQGLCVFVFSYLQKYKLNGY
jgi:hypothetical protein